MLKAKAAKAKYGLDAITVTNKDELAEVYVKHAKENNKKHLLEVPLMSAAERGKLLMAAKDDLTARNNKAGGEEGTVTEDEAKDLISAWKKGHPVVEEARVVDGGATWDYFIDVGDKTDTEKGKGKKGTGENLGDLSGAHDEFDTKSGDHHKLYIKKEPTGAYKVIIESDPTVYHDFIISHFEKIEKPSDEIIKAKDEALALAKVIDAKLGRLTSGDVEGTPETEKDLDDDLSKLASKTIKLIDSSSIGPIPDENIVFGGKVGSFGSSMSIKYLKSKTEGKESSNLPFDDNQILMQRKGDGGHKYYRNGHLLNANLHGPDDWKNLTPLSTTGNARHLSGIESKLKLALPTAGSPEFKAFKYVVIPDYSRGVNSSLIKDVKDSNNEYVEANQDVIIKIITAERFVPVSLRVESVELENVGGNWVEKSDSPYNIKDTILNPIGKTPEDYKVTNEKVVKYPVDFRKASEKEFLDAGFGQKTVDALIEVRRLDFDEEISTKEELYKEVLKNIKGSGGRITLDTLKKKINL